MKARLMILAITSLLLAGTAVAQGGGSWSFVASFDAPFDFLVSGTALPAGHYFVTTSSNGRTLMIQNADTARSAIAMNNNVMLTGNPYQHETTKVIFYPDSDGRQVLHQIMIVGDDHTHDLIHGASVAELPKR